MTRTNPPRPRRFGVITRCVTLLVLPIALLAGCGDDDDLPVNTPVPATRTPTRTPTVTPTVVNTSATAACQKLTQCQQCFINQTGNCLSTSDCAARLSGDIAACINGVGSCNATTLGDCLPQGCDGQDMSGECQ